MKKILFFLMISLYLLAGCSSTIPFYDIESYTIKYIDIEEKGTISVKMPFSDFIVVNNKLLIFTPQKSTSNGQILTYENNGESYSYVKSLNHTFGHCNSVDYNSASNLIMISSGGASTDPENKGFYLIDYKEDATFWNEYKFVNLNNIEQIGKQVNAYFLKNCDEQNIDVLILSNKNNVRLFTTIRLNLKDLNFQIIEYSEAFYTVDTCNQGGIIFNNCLFQSSGHDGIYMNISCADKNFNNIYGYKINYKKYKGYISEGIYIKDNIIYFGVLEKNSNSIIILFDYDLLLKYL